MVPGNEETILFLPEVGAFAAPGMVIPEVPATSRIAVPPQGRLLRLRAARKFSNRARLASERSRVTGM